MDRSESAARARSRDNHYVPEAMLRRWSTDGVHVFAYRTLVSHQRVPEWRRRPIRGVAFHRDLYTVFAGGREVDDVERWLATDIDGPGLDAIDKAIRGLRLSPKDWKSMVRLLAVQQLRTQLGFMEAMLFAQRVLPGVLERTVAQVIEEMKKVAETGIEPTYEPRPPDELTGLITVEIDQEPIVGEAGQAMRNVRARLSTGRRLWIANIRRVLHIASQPTLQHRWSLAAPFGDAEWPLTDHPSLRINYHGHDRYDFNGGWGHPGSEFLMPISPRLLLYAQVGSKSPNRLAFSREQTQIVQRLLVERAHRWIFATRPLDWISAARPRVVDPEFVDLERQHWDAFHQQQLATEIEDARRAEQRERDDADTP